MTVVFSMSTTVKMIPQPNGLKVYNKKATNTGLAELIQGNEELLAQKIRKNLPEDPNFTKYLDFLNDGSIENLLFSERGGIKFSKINFLNGRGEIMGISIIKNEKEIEWYAMVSEFTVYDIVKVTEYRSRKRVLGIPTGWKTRTEQESIVGELRDFEIKELHRLMQNDFKNLSKPKQDSKKLFF